MAVLKKLNVTGNVVSLLTNPDRESGLEKHPLDKVDVTLDGFAGDCHSGRVFESDVRFARLYKRDTPIANTRQISIVSQEELADVAEGLGVPEILPDWAGANLLTRGIPDLTLLPPCTRMVFSSGAVLIVSGENEPCRYVSDTINKHHPGKADAFPKVARHKRGLVAWVERAGAIAVGDEIVLHIPPQRIYAHA